MTYDNEADSVISFDSNDDRESHMFFDGQSQGEQ